MYSFLRVPLTCANSRGSAAATRYVAATGLGFFQVPIVCGRAIWIKGHSHVRFGSLADICSARRNVRFTPKSGHVQCN